MQSINEKNHILTATMNSYPSFGYENSREYDQIYESNFDLNSVTQINFEDGLSEYSDGDYSIYEQNFSDSYSDDMYDDELSSNFSYYTGSSFYDSHSERTSITTRSISGESVKSNRSCKQPTKLNGILKTRTSKKHDENNNTSNATITQDTIEKIRETELEDILQYAKDIIHPDPAAHVTYSSQPAKVIPGSFKHLLSVKEINSKTGAFKYRTIEITRNSEEEDLGFNVRQGDGWEKKDGIYISRVALGSVFDQYEILTVGDEVIQINKVDLKSMHVDDVVRLLHIPEKLSVTIKMLTPFSQKRVAQSDINKLRFQQKKFVASTSTDDVYKLAHMKISNKNIPSSKKNGDRNGQPKRTILVKRGTTPNNVSKEVRAVKISPYRSTEDGKAVLSRHNNNLSPISESMGEKPWNKNSSNMTRRQSNVTWSDQKSL